MSLKELTKDKHTKAENTKFMQCVFNQTLPTKLWNDYTLQRVFIYSAIETKCVNLNLIRRDSELIRAPKMMKDFLDSSGNDFYVRQATVDYQNYIRYLAEPQQILAHLYTWHMGDLFGGQQIKKIVRGVSHSALEFEDQKQCIAIIRYLCDKWNVAETNEPNVAFDCAIGLLETYNDML
jgi:heme oxygenase